jgi:hypothetical protein
MKIWSSILGLALLVAVVPAQSLNEYLAARKAAKVTSAVSVGALDSLVGTRTLEIQGTVKGLVRVDGRTSLLLEKADGGTIYVQAAAPPSWLDGGNETPVRLLVKATREHESAELVAELLSAIAEPQISAWEARNAPKKPAPRASSTPAAKGSTTGSGLQGQIGNARNGRGTRTSSRSAPTTSRGTARTTNTAGKTWVVPASEATPVYAQFIKNQNPRLSDKEAYRIAQAVVGFSLKHKVDARLVMAMMITESSINPNVTSHAGAMGLLQLMPGTARYLGVRDAYDVVDNIDGGIRYIRKMMDIHGETGYGLQLAVAAYNAGPGAVKKHGGIPPFRETQNYVRKVLGLYEVLSGQD